MGALKITAIIIGQIVVFLNREVNLMYISDIGFY